MPESTSAFLEKSKYIRGFTLHAADGDVGEVSDLLIDDQDWALRYLVIDTGPWIFGRKFLFSPHGLSRPDWEDRIFPVELNRESFERSPDIDLDRPVSKQQLFDLHRHYDWPLWAQWSAGTLNWPIYYPDPFITDAADRDEAASNPQEPEYHGDPHLRSVAEITGYDIQSEDGSLGLLEDVFIGTAEWEVEYILVDTHRWMPGRHVLVPVNRIRTINARRRTVSVALDRKQIRESPEYTPDEPGARPLPLAVLRKTGFDPYWIRFDG